MSTDTQNANPPGSTWLGIAEHGKSLEKVGKSIETAAKNLGESLGESLVLASKEFGVNAAKEIGETGKLWAQSVDRFSLVVAVVGAMLAMVGGMYTAAYYYGLSKL